MKGTRVYLEGRLRLEQWTGQDGVLRSTLKLTAWAVQPMGQIGRQRPRQPPRAQAVDTPRRVPEAVALAVANRNTR